MVFPLNFLFVLFIWLTPTKPVSDATIRQVVRTALRTGDAGQLSAQFARTIELVIDAEKVEFSSIQATHAKLILRSFFRKYPPHSFNFVYQGASDRLRYSTGTYETNGQTFTVYILFRQSANRQFTINSLHFRRES
ncbi:DUF4783 domain-containing protein [Spirosoma montaniterrae]|uniref:DUF4783 domain-containing protein n=1 Tax=Spirosoma montaniterrae TaxID=1178516 RepID=A0A1P9WT00_9BACT|nr:DUF4783 domain-containing protein [Spirosoma montaniterrae]AQG78515.1 hypothetical protein AWR27_03655 [Spirosoma montaniterrae]